MGLATGSEQRSSRAQARVDGKPFFALVPKLRLGMQSSELRSARTAATFATRPVYHASGRHADRPAYSPLGCEPELHELQPLKVSATRDGRQSA